MEVASRSQICSGVRFRMVDKEVKRQTLEEGNGGRTGSLR